MQAGREKEAAKKRLHSFLHIDIKDFGVWPPKKAKLLQKNQVPSTEETTEQAIDAPITRSKAKKAKK